MQNPSKTLHEIFREERSFKITLPPKIHAVVVYKSGKQKRREKRALERSLK